MKSQQNDFTKNADIVDHTENKQWLITQIENTLESYQNSLESNKEKFEGLTDNYLSKLTSRRNSVLSVVGLIISVIVGLAAIDFIQDIMKPWLMIVLVIDVVGGTVTYITANILMHRASKKLWDIEKAYDEGYIIQNFIKGFLSRRTLRINSVDINQLYTLHYYFIVLQGGITNKIISEYEKVYPKESYPKYYEGIVSKLYCLLIDNAYETYNSHKQEFEKEQFLDLFKVGKEGEELLKEFEGLIQHLLKRYEHINNNQMMSS
ncbi:MAG: hypothetical protein M3250_00025 [Thermoproteota archaeon]|nr:hypothetical protein [Thermoproteota archaeon]